MWLFLIEKITYFLKKKDQVVQEVQEEENEEYFDDTYYKEHIRIKNRNLEIFEKIVGDTPMKQIDWILINGLQKFNYWYECYEKGTIYQPATVELPPPKKTLDFFEPRSEMSYVRGGRGNSRLMSWDYSRE